MAKKKRPSKTTKPTLRTPACYKEPKLEEIRFLRGEDSPSKETWRTFRIMSEFIKGLDRLNGVSRGVSMFGSARIKPGSPYYELARKTAHDLGKAGFQILTGGGPGAMEASNRGAHEAGELSIGLNIRLPGPLDRTLFLPAFVLILQSVRKAVFAERLFPFSTRFQEIFRRPLRRVAWNFLLSLFFF